MHRRYFFWVALSLSLLFTGSPPALAGMPTEKIKETTNEILAIVTVPDRKDVPLNAEMKKKIRKAVDKRFDWEEMARRSLARHWKERTEQEKTQFVVLFGQLLERTYLDKVEGYSGEKVVYLGESIDDNYAVVNVKIITAKNEEIDVAYRLRQKGNDWLVYDISVAGVSLVNNYRVQFNSIITRSSYASLVERLKEKIAPD